MKPNVIQNIDSILPSLRRTAERMQTLGSCEGAAGNLSIFLRLEDKVDDRFPLKREYSLPVEAPALAGGTLLVTGSGQRLSDIPADHNSALGVLSINTDGKTGTLYTTDPCRFSRLTSEFNSHLAVHQNHVSQNGGNYHAVIHVQPKNITFLSHIPLYQDPGYLNRHLLRWQPEMILNFPKGIGILPFMPPASQTIMEASQSALEELTLVVWSKHGVLARSEHSIEQAADLVEYVETAAQYEYMNLVSGNPAGGLTIEEMLSVCRMYGVQPEILKAN